MNDPKYKERRKKRKEKRKERHEKRMQNPQFKERYEKGQERRTKWRSKWQARQAAKQAAFVKKKAQQDTVKRQVTMIFDKMLRNLRPSCPLPKILVIDPTYNETNSTSNATEAEDEDDMDGDDEESEESSEDHLHLVTVLVMNSPSRTRMSGSPNIAPAGINTRTRSPVPTTAQTTHRYLTRNWSLRANARHRATRRVHFQEGVVKGSFELRLRSHCGKRSMAIL